MSLLDQVRKLEQQVMSRLKELEPLMREYDQLRRVAQRLGLDYSSASKPASEPAEGTATAPRAAAKKRTAAKARAAAKPRAKRAVKARAGAGGARRATRTRQAESGAATAAPSKATPSKAAATAAPSKPAAAPSKPARSARGAGARKGAATRPGQRFEDVMRVVSANPGITVREVGAQLGVDATGLYRVAKRLTDEGRLRKDGTRLFPAESGAADAAAPVSSEGTPAAGAAQAGEPAAGGDAPTTNEG